jgi:hypothetical protein
MEPTRFFQQTLCFAQIMFTKRLSIFFSMLALTVTLDVQSQSLPGLGYCWLLDWRRECLRLRFCDKRRRFLRRLCVVKGAAKPQ